MVSGAALAQEAAGPLGDNIARLRASGESSRKVA
jgi:hypothetical protein